MSCTNSGNGSLYHNFCCHGIPKSEKSDDWLTPIQQAFEKGIQMAEVSGSEEEKGDIISQNELKRRLEVTALKEKQFRQLDVGGKILKTKTLPFLFEINHLTHLLLTFP